jgi:hypothetical protein
MEEILKKDINNCTKKEFESLPKREWGEDIGEFDSLIILPTNEIHKPSGYIKMFFVLVRNNRAFCKISGCSDILHLDGISGTGEIGIYDDIPEKIPPKAWQVDCLKKSRLIRIYSRYYFKIGDSLSDFQLFATRKI